MKLQFRKAAIPAVKWAFLLSAGIIVWPLVIGLASGTGVNGDVMAQKVVSGLGLFPVLFVGLWLWGTFTKKDPVTGASIESPDQLSYTSGTKSTAPSVVASQIVTTTDQKLSAWNYVGVGVGVFMLLFLFLPQIMSGALATQNFLGAAFWVGVVTYSTVNIVRAKKN